MTDLLTPPVRVVSVDAEGPFPSIARHDPDRALTYTGARVFVWDDDRPCGSFDVALSGAISGTDVSALVNDHVRASRHHRNSSASPVTRPVHRASATVVIATRNRPDSLIRCIESLITHAIGVEDVPSIVVVDSAPADDAARLALRERFGLNRHIRYLCEARPGLAIAHNAALPHVSTEFVLFTDDDVVVDRRWVTALLRTFADWPRAVCVTGRILPAELETETQCMIDAAAGFDKGIARQVFDLLDHRPSDPLFPFTAGAFGSGANMAFRTEYLRSAGGFDGALGAGSRGVGGDDLAAFIGVIAAGHQLVYEPAAAVFHHHHRDPVALERQARAYGIGLTAAVTASIARHPRLLAGLLRRVPRAIGYASSPHSAKNSQRPTGYPRELARRELIGMALGPLAYARSRMTRVARTARRSPTTANAPTALSEFGE